MFNIVFVPGYGGSKDGHWLKKWHQQFTRSYWVEQSDWFNPCCVDWVENLNHTIKSIKGPIVLIAHSLGCNTVVEWSKQYTGNIVGVFLVALPDIESIDLPSSVSGFQSPPLQQLPFPSVMIASTDDPYCKFERASHFASTWGCELVSIGNSRHIDSPQLAAWPEGSRQLNKFLSMLA